jgi:hypothetical protein
METANFTIQLCQSKFTFRKVKASKNFGEFIKFFQIWLDLKFSSNSKVVLLPGISIVHYLTLYHIAKLGKFWSNISVVFIIYKFSSP